MGLDGGSLGGLSRGVGVGVLPILGQKGPELETDPWPELGEAILQKGPASGLSFV